MRKQSLYLLYKSLSTGFINDFFLHYQRVNVSPALKIPQIGWGKINVSFNINRAKIAKRYKVFIAILKRNLMASTCYWFSATIISNRKWAYRTLYSKRVSADKCFYKCLTHILTWIKNDSPFSAAKNRNLQNNLSEKINCYVHFFYGAFERCSRTFKDLYLRPLLCGAGGH